MDEPTELLKAMDDAAIGLLNAAKAEPSVPTEGEGRHAPSISERVKVFEAVGKYLEWRTRSGPPAPEPERPPSKFDQLREQLHGRDTASPGGGAAKGGRSTRRRGNGAAAGA